MVTAFLVLLEGRSSRSGWIFPPASVARGHDDAEELADPLRQRTLQRTVVVRKIFRHATRFCFYFRRSWCVVPHRSFAAATRSA